jgi:hypothetical protein
MLASSVSALVLAATVSCSSSNDAVTGPGLADGAASPVDGAFPSGGDGAVTNPDLDAAGGGDTGSSTPPDGGMPDADSGLPPPPADCTGTSDCPATMLCCAHLTLGPDTFPACGIADNTSACEATCSTIITNSCSTTVTARRCHSSADCTSSSNNLCCTITDLGGIAICANTTVVSQHGGGVCN